MDKLFNRYQLRKLVRFITVIMQFLSLVPDIRLKGIVLFLSTKVSILVVVDKPSAPGMI